MVIGRKKTHSSRLLWKKKLLIVQAWPCRNNLEKVRVCVILLGGWYGAASFGFDHWQFVTAWNGSFFPLSNNCELLTFLMTFSCPFFCAVCHAGPDKSQTTKGNTVTTQRSLWSCEKNVEFRFKSRVVSLSLSLPPSLSISHCLSIYLFSLSLSLHGQQCHDTHTLALLHFLTGQPVVALSLFPMSLYVSEFQPSAAALSTSIASLLMTKY